MIELTDTASDKVKQLIEAEASEARCPPGRGTPGWLLGHELRDVLRHRTGRRRRRARLRRGQRRGRPASAQHLTGATLDFKDGLQGAGFTINNPNAQRTCGCGQSFS